MVDGKRDGYGIVYSTTHDNNTWLYECEWKQGSPVNKGRYIWILNNKWRKYEGPLMNGYLLTGTGSMQNEDGHSYQGDYKQGERQGQGQWNWSNRDSFLGQWQNDSRIGQGRYTNADGTYYEGEWMGDKQVGVHKHYNKDGVLTKEQDHK
ncbi:hypothetical protein FGO68_gene9293 [Halteria grandinella]|uniref:MORN repeat protein n=1 Tax=Halteria grandinella TaxID=5974 RepID=A0A8J8T4S3_HALGN|nr:hypothetical protein FGO68_gene9293 [Halteria grandinella]